MINRTVLDLSLMRRKEGKRLLGCVRSRLLHALKSEVGRVDKANSFGLIYNVKKREKSDSLDAGGVDSPAGKDQSSVQFEKLLRELHSKST